MICVAKTIAARMKALTYCVYDDDRGLACFFDVMSKPNL